MEDIKALRDQLTVLDNFVVTPVPGVVDLIRQEDVEFNKPALDFLLRHLQMPASYFSKASPDLQRRMLIESCALHKEEVVRLVYDESKKLVLGCGPDLHEDMNMSKVFDAMPGDYMFHTGDVLNSGTIYATMVIDKMRIGGQDAVIGYTCMLSPMFNRSITMQPSLTVIICTNGLTDPVDSGSEFSPTIAKLSPDYLQMMTATIPAVVTDSMGVYEEISSNALKTPVVSVEAQSLVQQWLGQRRISKTIAQKAIKVIEVVNLDEPIDDPAHPTQITNMWELIQLMAFCARNFSARTRLSTEVQLMKLLKNDLK